VAEKARHGEFFLKKKKRKREFFWVYERIQLQRGKGNGSIIGEGRRDRKNVIDHIFVS
jgi:hypothetical protein